MCHLQQTLKDVEAPARRVTATTTDLVQDSETTTVDLVREKETTLKRLLDDRAEVALGTAARHVDGIFDDVKAAVEGLD